MSNEAITWAYSQEIESGAKFVLVALADLADEAHSCYPGQAKLAAMTGRGERTVRRDLLDLESRGFITRARRFDGAGHRTSDRYVLPVGQLIPTGQNGQRPDGPAAKSATGQNDLRSSVQSLPAIYDSPTGQVGQVSLREPSGEPSVKPSSSEVAPRPDVEYLCDLLAKLVEANGSKPKTVDKRWRDSCRLLLDRDGRTSEQVEKAIRWSQQDEFWRANIMSMPKLREKYDQLRLAAQRKPPAPKGPRRDANLTELRPDGRPAWMA